MRHPTTPTIVAFTLPQVQRLTGLTARRLVYWDKTGVFSPTYKDDRAYRAYRRIYSFCDVVSLRTLIALRDQFGVSLDELRKTGEHLMQFSDDPQSKRFWVKDGRVFFHLSELSEHPVDRHRQTTYLDFGPMWDEVERDAARWTERDPKDIGQVSRHRHVQHNQWVIKGTRIPTSAVWSFHAAGHDTAEIIRQYPTLHAADVEAAIMHERQQRSEAA